MITAEQNGVFADVRVFGCGLGWIHFHMPLNEAAQWHAALHAMLYPPQPVPAEEPDA